MGQIERVLASIKGGAEASFEIADETGLAQSSVAAYLGKLEKMGRIEACGVFHAPDRPKPFTRWKVTTRRQPRAPSNDAEIERRNIDEVAA